MIITAFFTNNGIPATGISPTIRIRKLSNDALVITDAAMSEVGDGNYKYDFLAYDSTLDYTIRCDGGISLTGAERYTYGGNENYVDDVSYAVWSEQVSAYDSFIPSAGFGFGQAEIALLYGEYIYVDANSPFSGTGLGTGNGAQNKPVNTISDAVTIANQRSIRKLLILSSITVEATDNISEKSLETIGTMGIDLTITAGASADGAVFRNLNITGELLNGDAILLNDCSVLDFENFSGIMNNVAFGENVEIGLGNWAVIIDGTAGGSAGSEPEISIGTADLNMSQWTGNINLKGKTGTNRTTLNTNSGNIIISSSCVSGSIQILGVGQIERDDSGPNCNVDIEGFISNENIADFVWDEPLDEHGSSGSTGKKLKDIGASVILTGNAQGGNTINTIGLDSFASTVDGAYDPALITIVEGTGAGQSRGVYQYDGTTRTAVVDRNWKTIPTTASEYVISAWPGREHVNEGLAQDGTINTITLNTLASSADGAYNNQAVFIRSGGAEDQVRMVIDYDGTTKVATLEHDWNNIPDSTSAYVMLPYHIHFTEHIAAAVWEEELIDHTIPGTYGAEVATKADLAASTSTTFTTAITGDAIFGTETGTFVNTYVRDGIYWQITESAADGITVEFIFYIPDEDRAGVIDVFGRYTGFPAGTHYQELWAYNYAASAWEQLVEVFMPGGNMSDSQYQHEYYERHINRSNNNEVRIQIIHNITAYNVNHDLYLDYVAVTSIDVITAEEIADAVWSEPVSGYNDTDAFGGLVREIYSNTVSISASLINISNDLKRALGLMHENIFIDDPVYDANCNLTSARVRIYSDSISVGTSASVIGEYDITAPATEPGKFTTWKQVRV